MFHLKSSFRSQDIYIWRKNGLNRKIRLKFVTSQPGKQRITILILPNISQSKGNQIIKFGQLIEYNKRNTEAERLVSGLFFVFWKSFIWGKSKRSAALFQYISIALNLAYNKTKLYKRFDNWSSMVFPKTCYPCLYPINWASFIYCLTVFTSWGIGQYVYCNCLLTRMWRHKSWYLGNEKTLYGEIKEAVLIIFKGL